MAKLKMKDKMGLRVSSLIELLESTVYYLGVEISNHLPFLPNILVEKSKIASA
jgi:hypothetical protein